MKKFATIFLFTFLILSCKNNAEPKLSYIKENTIKSEVQQKENTIAWSKEIEGERLTTPVNEQYENVSSKVDLNLELIKILPETQNAIYPEFDNFGKLDISALNTSAKEKIKSFCDTFCKGELTSLAEYFESTYLFNYIFFINELKDEWKTRFAEEFPEYKSQENNSNEAELTSTELTPPLFIKYLLGEPFLGEKIIQIPVRFYCNTTTLDVTLYLNTNEKYSIYQITIDRWGKV